MEEFLKDVSAVVGVTGSFVCDGEGRVVARALPTVFDEAILSTVGRTATQTFAGLETVRRRKVQDLDLVYGEGRLVAKNLKNGCLCILCVRNINLPLLNLTANLAAKKLREMIKGRLPARKAEARESDARLRESLTLLSHFIELLVEEWGDRGFGRDDLLQMLQDRLRRLEEEYPSLGLVRIEDGRVDLSSLESASEEEVVGGLGKLIEEAYLCSAERIGPRAAGFKYNRVYEGFWHLNEEACRRLKLMGLLKRGVEPADAAPLAGVELTF